MKLKASMLAFFTIFLLLFLSGCTSDNSNDPAWMNNYTPVHSAGNGADNFWINFPPGSPSSGGEVDHLSWIVTDLKTKPVLFVVHRTGCQPCTPQAERVIALAEKYEGYVKLYDLDITGASEDTTKKYNDVFMYDVTSSNAIAFTGAYTYVKDNGEVKIGWHTWVGNVADAEMETWIKDAIYYYNINK